LRAGEPEIFTYFSDGPQTWTLEAFQAYIQALASRPAWCAFAIVLQETGEAIGETSYMDIRPAHRGLEIGHTWIARPHQGTRVNPENKYLLLRHAFEELEAVRVQLKCDARNLQSQRAIEKLGAQREGVLRKHIILPDGYVRDTVMYSIVEGEWPRVKASLEARLDYAP
jgi:ribosomal-protein-alanine N-acetyltransferase